MVGKFNSSQTLTTIRDIAKDQRLGNLAEHREFLKNFRVVRKFKNSLAFTGRTIAISAALLAIMVFGFAIWVQIAAKQMDRATQQRYDSYMLADELRQSSDDLTRLARTYVLTANPLYEQMYMDILAIRSGEKERPSDYNAIYWDFVAAGMPVPEGSGVTKPLLELMKEAGFTAEEFELLDKAAANSAGLIGLEVEAMNAVKGLYKDIDGAYTIKGEPDMKLAAELMHSEEYHRFKGDIMKPINEFLLTMQNRFDAKLSDLAAKQSFATRVSEVAGGLMFLLSIVLLFVISQRILNPLSEISATMAALSNGDKVGDIPGLNKTDEIGVMAQTAAKFRESSEEAMRLSEEVKIASVENERIAKEQMKAAEEAAETGRKEQERMAASLEESERAKVFQKEIAAVVDAFSQGDFSRRIDMHDKTGVFVEMCNGINRIGEETEGSLSELNECLHALKEGDLLRHMSEKHVGIFKDMADTLNGTCEGLVQTVGAIKQSSDTIAMSSQGVASTAESTAKQTERSAATLEEIAAAIHELTASVRSTSNGATGIQERVQSTRKEASDCADTARETAQAMEEINHSSKEISNITTVIDEIAFQTNLLALNAGVEAARAGDAGRGFAVVATEVSALAQRSSEAAKEIKDLISKSESQVGVGVEKVNESNSALERILVAVRTIADEITEIADATNEQSSAISEINTAVNKLDGATQKNAAHMEETTAAAMLLREEAGTLMGEIGKFKTTEQSNGRSQAA